MKKTETEKTYSERKKESMLELEKIARENKVLSVLLIIISIVLIIMSLLPFFLK